MHRILNYVYLVYLHVGRGILESIDGVIVEESYVDVRRYIVPRSVQYADDGPEIPVFAQFSSNRMRRQISWAR